VPWYLPVLIFLARVCDVSIGTVRIIFVIRGNKFIAAVLGFFEVTIWIFAVSAVIANITSSPIGVIAYGLGFAAGTLVGMVIEEKLAIGTQMIRVVNVDMRRGVVRFLRNRGFLVTEVQATGGTGKAELCFLVVPRKKTHRVLEMLQHYNPRAFITVEDVRHTAGSTTLFKAQASRLQMFRRWIKLR